MAKGLSQLADVMKTMFRVAGDRAAANPGEDWSGAATVPELQKAMQENTTAPPVISGRNISFPAAPKASTPSAVPVNNPAPAVKPTMGTLPSFAALRAAQFYAQNIDATPVKPMVTKRRSREASKDLA